MSPCTVQILHAKHVYIFSGFKKGRFKRGFTLFCLKHALFHVVKHQAELLKPQLEQKQALNIMV